MALAGHFGYYARTRRTLETDRDRGAELTDVETPLAPNLSTDATRPNSPAGSQSNTPANPVSSPVDSSIRPVEDEPTYVLERLVAQVERRRLAWTRVDTVAAEMVLVHLLLLLLIVARGSFYVGDLQAQTSAVGHSFWQFVTATDGARATPLPRALDWIAARWFPLRHGPAVAVTLAVRMLLALGFWRVLRRLFGPRVVTLVPLALLLFTPALIPATAWYRSALTVLICTTAVVWAVDAHLRWVLYRHRTDLVVLAAVTLIGLACYQQTAALPVFLLGFTLAVFTSRDRRFRSELLAALLGVLVSAVTVAAAVVAGQLRGYDHGSLPSILDVGRLSWSATNRTVLPLLLGGPYRWTHLTPFAGVPRPGLQARTVALLVLLVALAVIARRAPQRVVRALVLLLACLLPTAAIVVAGRSGWSTRELTTAAGNTRLWATLVPGFLLAGALAAIPSRVGVNTDPHIDSPADENIDAGENADGVIGGSKRGRVWRIPIATLGGALVIVLALAGSVVSSLAYASDWWNNPTDRWLADVRGSLGNAEPRPRTLATPIPAWVVPAWATKSIPTDAELIRMFRPDSRFYDGDGPGTVLNDFGFRSLYKTNVLASTPPGICTAALPVDSSDPVTVRFPLTVRYQTNAQIEVGLLLSSPTRIGLQIAIASGDIVTPQRLSNDELSAGPHTLHLPVPYGQSVSAVLIQAQVAKNSCISAVRVWTPQT
jgi:hypothetical protein